MLSDWSYSVSDIQGYIEYIIKKATNYPIHIHINRDNNGVVFKVTDGYKLELKLPETMTLLVARRKLIDKTKNGKNVPSFEVVEVVLVQCNLIDNQYQQKSEILFTFMPNKSYAYLLNFEPRNLVFLKTYLPGFDDIS